MGTILKSLFVFFVGALLVYILIPVVSIGSAINKSAKKDSERLTKAAKNFDQLYDREKSLCEKREKDTYRNPLPANICSCIVANSIEYSPAASSKALSKHIAKNGPVFYIPESILLDTFYRGNISDQLAKVKLKALVRKDKNLPKALESNYFENLEVLIVKKGVSKCSSSFRQDFTDLASFRATKYRYSDLERQIKAIHSIKKRHAELITN